MSDSRFSDLVEDYHRDREGKDDASCYTPACPDIDCADCPIVRGEE